MPVVPMYIPGRRRTASSPSKTVMSADSYVLLAGLVAMLPPPRRNPIGAGLLREGELASGVQIHRNYTIGITIRRTLGDPDFRSFHVSTGPASTATLTPSRAPPPRTSWARTRTSDDRNRTWAAQADDEAVISSTPPSKATGDVS